MKASALRVLRALPLLLPVPLLLAVSALAIALADLAWLVAGRRQKPVNAAPHLRAASLVIPNWNGRDLLARFLPSWLDAIANHPGSEIIVVDNGSTDGSAAWLQTIAALHTSVRVLALPAN